MSDQRIIDLKKIVDEDASLTAEQLDDKYNPDGDGRHPIYGEEGWMQDVLNRNTLLGYWEWVRHQLVEESER